MEVGSAGRGEIPGKSRPGHMLMERTGMKLATFKVGETATWGTIEGESALDLGSVLGDRFPDLKSLIAQDGYSEAQEASASAPRYSLEDVDWLPVVPNPEKIFCVGLNYEMHRKETGRAEVAHPTIFTRFANTQTGHLTRHCSPRCFDTTLISKANWR